MKRVFAFGILFSLIILQKVTTPVFAGGGGRAVITVLSPGVSGGKSAEIVATIYKDNDMKLSLGEKGLFRVKNAQGGQSCLTKNEASDDQGRIFGSCSSSVTGDMEVYIHFPDKVEDAYPYKVQFVEKSQEKAATAQVQATQKKKASAPCGSGLVSYGWDPSNGRSCDSFHFNAWTAYCGNGYQEDVQLDRCVYANDLSSDWKVRAEAICNNPRCDAKPTPAVVASPKPKASPSPKPTTPKPTATLSASPVSTPSASPVPSSTTPSTPGVKDETTLFELIGSMIGAFFRQLFKR